MVTPAAQDPSDLMRRAATEMQERSWQRGSYRPGLFATLAVAVRLAAHEFEDNTTPSPAACALLQVAMTYQECK